MKIAMFLASFVLAVTVAVPSVYAADFAAPEKDGDGSITISGDQRKNLYTAGSEVTITAPITGDLFAAGGKVMVSADVEQDLVVAGGTVAINNKVGGDVRIGGGDVTISAPIGGDVIVAGGTVTILATSSVGGDVVIAGGRIKLEAPITGSVRAAGGDITINNTVGGKVWVQSDKSLTFGSNAKAAQAVVYKGKKEAVVAQGAEVPSIQFEKIERKPLAAAKAFIGGAILIKLLAMIIAAWLLAYFLPNRTRAIIHGVQNNTWMNLAVGFLGMVAIPVLIFVLFLTFVGYYAALIVLVWFVFAIMLTSLLTAIFVGAYVDRWLLKRPELVVDWQAVVIGVVVMTIISFIPVFGWIAGMVLMLIVFGALLRFLKQDIATNK
jgi:hypothetical protein